MEAEFIVNYYGIAFLLRSVIHYKIIAFRSFLGTDSLSKIQSGIVICYGLSSNLLWSQ